MRIFKCKSYIFIMMWRTLPKIWGTNFVIGTSWQHSVRYKFNVISLLLFIITMTNLFDIDGVSVMHCCKETLPWFVFVLNLLKNWRQHALIVQWLTLYFLRPTRCSRLRLRRYGKLGPRHVQGIFASVERCARHSLREVFLDFDCRARALTSGAVAV